MATWGQLTSYIHETYSATDVSPRAIVMQFETGNGRSQRVFVSSLEAPDGSQWASIDSPVGTLDSIDLPLALRSVGDLVCGGLAHLYAAGEDLAVIRHSVPLKTLDTDEFVQPLVMVTTSADQMEQILTGADRH